MVEGKIGDVIEGICFCFFDRFSFKIDWADQIFIIEPKF
jgi:hypothetical protein